MPEDPEKLNAESLIKSTPHTWTMRDSLIRVVRSGLQLLPLGIGAAIEEGYFGTQDERRTRRIETFLAKLAEDLKALEGSVTELDTAAFKTEEFAYLFESVLRRISVDVQRDKLSALRGALISIMVEPYKIPFDKKSSFLKTLDAWEDIHIHLMRLLAAHYQRMDTQRYLSISEMCKRLGATTDADQNFLYSALDTLANREFVKSGPIPWTSNKEIDKPNQTFRATDLGMEFLTFIRVGNVQATDTNESGGVVGPN